MAKEAGDHELMFNFRDIRSSVTHTHTHRTQLFSEAFRKTCPQGFQLESVVETVEVCVW